MKHVDWTGPYPILGTALRESKDTSDDSSTEEEDSSDEEMARKKSSLVAAVPLKYRDSSSTLEDSSSEEEEDKKPAASPKKKRPPKKTAGQPATKRGRGAPPKEAGPHDCSSAEESSNDDKAQRQAVARELRLKKRVHPAKDAEPLAKRGRLPKKNEAKPYINSATVPTSVTSSSTARRVTPTAKTPKSAATANRTKKPLEDYSPDEVAKLFDDKADIVSELFQSDDEEEEEGKELHDLAKSLEKYFLGGAVFAEHLDKGDDEFLKFLEHTLGLEGDKMFCFSVMDTLKKAM